MKTTQKQRQYMKRWREHNPDYMRLYGRLLRKTALAKINPQIKCNRCGCDMPECLEINHKNGGGGAELRKIKLKTLHHKIKQGKRKTHDLEILCRPCNAIDHLERKVGHILPMRVIWKKRGIIK